MIFDEGHAVKKLVTSIAIYKNKKSKMTRISVLGFIKSAISQSRNATDNWYHSHISATAWKDCKGHWGKKWGLHRFGATGLAISEDQLVVSSQPKHLLAWTAHLFREIAQIKQCFAGSRGQNWFVAPGNPLNWLVSTRGAGSPYSSWSCAGSCADGLRTSRTVHRPRD